MNVFLDALSDAWSQAVAHKQTAIRSRPLSPRHAAFPVACPPGL